MTGFIRRNLPADIAIFSGDIDNQPLVFAHLLVVAPELDLEHVEVIQIADPTARLRVYFPAETCAKIREDQGRMGTLVLILPAAYGGLNCPLADTEHLTSLGVFRGTVTRLSPHNKG